MRSALAAEDADGLAEVVDFLCAFRIAAQDAGDAGAAQFHAGEFEVQGVQPLQQVAQTGGVDLAGFGHARQVVGAQGAAVHADLRGVLQVVVREVDETQADLDHARRVPARIRWCWLLSRGLSADRMFHVKHRVRRGRVAWPCKFRGMRA